MIITLDSCSQADFESVLYTVAQEGDTIVLPSGSATWGNPSGHGNAGKVFVTMKDLTIMGQGDSTVITMHADGATYANGVINLWAPVVWKDMKIIGATGSPVSVFNLAAYTNPTTEYQMRGGFRLTNITYEGHSDGYFVYVESFVDNGLIDNCRLSCDVGFAELILMRGRTDAWQLSNTMGGADNLFIEDNVFSDTGYVCDANSNARMVVRYNTINGTNKVDGHGLASNTPPRSVRNMEIYGNTWTKTGAGNWTNIEIRGGTAMVFNNTSVTGWFFLHDYAYDASPHAYPNFGFGGTSTAGNPTIITTSSNHGYSTGWPVWVQAPLGVIFGMYEITVTGANTFTIPVSTVSNETIDYATTYKTPFDYPIADQVGNGKDGEAREPAYVWGNVQDGSPWGRTLGTVSTEAIDFYRAQTEDEEATFTDKDVIQSNRDFFADAGFDDNTGMSVGTRAEMDAMTPSVTGYGYWVTDEGSWHADNPGTSGRLYVWDGDSWNLHYEPYTYPHPLRSVELPAASRPGSPSTSAMAAMC